MQGNTQLPNGYTKTLLCINVFFPSLSSFLKVNLTLKIQINTKNLFEN